jgi:Protein of unknown function (DUF2384)
LQGIRDLQSSPARSQAQLGVHPILLGAPDLQPPPAGPQAQLWVFPMLGNIGIGTPTEQPAPARPALRQGLGYQGFWTRAPLARPVLQGRVTGPVRLIQQIARAWSLTNSELANMLAYPSETLVPALLEGRITFATETDQGDRVRIMYAIHSTLTDLFVDASDEGRWLRDRLPILENMSPLAYMLQKRIPGMLAVQDLVERRMANR